jgi:hypothetical protein
MTTLTPFRQLLEVAKAIAEDLPEDWVAWKAPRGLLPLEPLMIQVTVVDHVDL